MYTRRSILAASLTAPFLASGFPFQWMRSLGLESLANAAESQVGSKSSPSEAAVAFLETLKAEQKEKTQFEYESPQRVKWNFVPMNNRKGLPLRDMTEEQRTAALGLLRSLVSDAGYERSLTTMALEKVLHLHEGPASADRRDPTKYHYCIYGNPSDKGTWAVSIEGHHLSLNLVFHDGVVVDSTPQFFGANPATFQADTLDRFTKGYRALQNEEQFAFDLLKSLTAEQKSKAIIAAKAPAEIDSPGSAQPAPTPPRGLTFTDLKEEQQQILRKLIATYTLSMVSKVAEERIALIDKAGFDKVHFAWAGPDAPGVGHYYCIQGPTFVIEFVNVQADALGNIANHIHCVWRDLQGDFNLAPVSA